MKIAWTWLRQAHLSKRFASRHSTKSKAPFLGADLHDYTSGRYLFNERLRLEERHLPFDVDALVRTICNTIDRPLEDLRGLEKFAEGGFNRILQATFHDGREFLAKLPFRLEAPIRHSLASEAATLSFLHGQELPVPRVLAYSPDVDNPVGIEYILLDKVPGHPLGESWFSLEPKAVAKIMKQIVDFERKLMALKLPASGSMYFRRDVRAREEAVPIEGASTNGSDFVVGPTASYAWWYRERAALDVDRGPWKDYLTCFEAPAKRELAFCEQYGKSRHNVERYLRELDNLELQHPSRHIELLQDFLKVSPSLDLSTPSRFIRPTIRHPDLSPNNILINEHHEIVGIIDWQHTVALPLCLAAGIPKYFQNWGDPISESLQKPETKLPSDFDSLDPATQSATRDTMRKRLVHFYYAALTLRKNEDHFDAFRNFNSMLRAKLYDRACAPWEGSSTDLEHALVEVQQHWPLDMEGSAPAPSPECPLQYTPERIQGVLQRAKKEEEMLDELDDMRAMLGTDAIGWVQDDEHFAQANAMLDVMRTAFAKEAETEVELIAAREHFPFDDHKE